jgi:DNA-binding response OmpR family regulator
MSAPKPLICVVDDEESVRRTLCAKLEAAGFHTLQAKNGTEALDLLSRSQVAVVVLDIIMPEKEGLSTIVDIKALHPPPPILAISGGGTGDAYDYLRYAKELGADDILMKPIRGEEFVERVRRLAERGPAQS